MTRFNQQRILINQGGMGVLGGWSLANFAIGGYGMATTTGKEQYFHGMNVFWNVVNATISFPALIRHTRMDLNQENWAEAQAANRKNERVFLINGGLDILYMGSGALMVGLADQTQNQDLFQGFGESFILQGAFLFVFDLGMWAILRGHRKGHENKWSQRLGLFPGGIRYRIG
ncbi:hypothetical protein KFE98_13370 [bacterium SCSIO 12741]|nr:hypothetical protein KFE98_13370 [bacterium SCSIO 12741]